MFKHTAAIILVIFTIVFLANDALADMSMPQRHLLSDIELTTYHIDQAGYLQSKDSGLEFQMTSSSGAVMVSSGLKVSLTQDDGYHYSELVDLSDYFKIDTTNQRLYLDSDYHDVFYNTIRLHVEHTRVLALLIEALDSHDQLVYVAVPFRQMSNVNYQSAPVIRHYYSSEPMYEGC